MKLKTAEMTAEKLALYIHNVCIQYIHTRICSLKFSLYVLCAICIKWSANRLQAICGLLVLAGRKL